MFDINVKVTLSADDSFKKVLNDVMGLFGGGQVKTVAVAATTKEDRKPETKVAEQEDTKAEDTAKQEIAIEDIRALAAGKAKDVVKGMLKKYGVANLSSLKKEDYEEFYQELEMM